MTDTEASPDLVRVKVETNGVARITLDRAARANAMDLEFLRTFHRALLRCRGDGDIRAVLLAGEGKNFCAGGDVRAFAEQGDQLPGYLRETVGWMQLAASALIEFPAPVIAAVQGSAAGGAGFGLVCASDFVIAGESATFFGPGTGLGMTPDAGTSVTLVNLVGFRKAMEILLTNQPLGAREAADLGLITQVVPDSEIGERAYQLASDLAAGPRDAIAATKRLLWDGIGAGVAERLPAEAWALSALSDSDDVREGLASFVERRKPNFLPNR